MSLEVTSKGDWDKLMDCGDMTFVVDFTATWCGPCRAIGPFFEKLSMQSEYRDLAFLKVDVDQVAEVATEAEISAMPTFQVWRGGVRVDELVGSSKEQLLALVDRAVADSRLTTRRGA